MRSIWRGGYDMCLRWLTPCGLFAKLRLRAMMLLRLETANELLRLSEEHGLPLTRAIALVYLGWALGQANDNALGVQRMEEGLTAYYRLGPRNNLTFAICLSAETYLMDKQYEKGMGQVNAALTASSEIGDRWCLPQINMIRARILQQTGFNGDAETSLRIAIDVAQSQGAKGFELRAATSLARLQRDQGNPQQAHELLAPVYGWFTEGFDTRDLKEAKALLDQLAS
jgi:predicted ATPase